MLRGLNKSTIAWFISLHKIIFFIPLSASSHVHLARPFSLGFLYTNLLVIPNLYPLTHKRNFECVFPSTWNESPTPSLHSLPLPLHVFLSRGLILLTSGYYKVQYLRICVVILISWTPHGSHILFSHNTNTSLQYTHHYIKINI